jgi:hypothetical protein
MNPSDGAQLCQEVQRPWRRIDHSQFDVLNGQRGTKSRLRLTDNHTVTKQGSTAAPPAKLRSLAACVFVILIFLKL